MVIIDLIKRGILMKQMPIRVLQVGMSPYYGGTEAFIMAQYRNIDRQKVQFDFLNVYNERIACEEEIQLLGGHIYQLDMARHHGIRQYYKNLDNFFSLYSKNFSAIHCNFQSLINIDLLKYAKKYNVPLRIAHAHNSGYGSIPSFKQKCLIKLNKFLLPYYANTLFACSNLAGNWMFGNHDVQIIHNAIDAEKFIFSNDKRIEKRRELGLRDEVTVLFVGRLDPQKNVFFLIDIIQQLIDYIPNVKLLIVGDGLLKQAVEQKIIENQLEASIQLLGSRKDVNELLQAADIFLLPSNFEGLGIVLIEAQAAGLPCYTSKKVVPAEVDISGLVQFIDLSESAKRWAEYIFHSYKKYGERKNTLRIIQNAGYDSRECIKVLENIYLNG